MLSILLSLIACEPMKVVFETESSDTGNIEVATDDTDLELIGDAPDDTDLELIGDAPDDTDLTDDTGAEQEPFAMTLMWYGGENWDAEAEDLIVMEAHTYGVRADMGSLSIYDGTGNPPETFSLRASDDSPTHGILVLTDVDSADGDAPTTLWSAPLPGLTFVYQNISVTHLPGFEKNCIVVGSQPVDLQFADCTRLTAFPVPN